MEVQAARKGKTLEYLAAHKGMALLDLVEAITSKVPGSIEEAEQFVSDSISIVKKGHYMKHLGKLVFVMALAYSMLPSLVLAQQTTNPPVQYPTATGNFSAPGQAIGFLNPSGGFIPGSAANPIPFTGTFTPSGTQDVNVKQWGTGTVGAMANYGTSPGAVLVPGVNAYVTDGPRKTTTQAKVTISVTNTFQQALASASTRAGCTLQYIAVAGSKGYVFFGSAPGDTTTSYQLTNGQSISCAIGGFGVATDAVQVTATGTDIFVVSNQ